MILVDGDSIDGTVEVARELRPDVGVVQQTRRGKGNALACGFAACTGDIIVMIDADGSTDPAEIPLFVEALVAGADFVKGSRFADGGRSDDITRCAGSATTASTASSTCCSAPGSPTSATATTPSGAGSLPVAGPARPGSPAPADGSKLWGDGFEIETLINIRAAPTA